MDRYEKKRYQYQLKNPSFSSTLLDTIYRSIDKGNSNINEEQEETELVLYQETMRKKQSMQSEKWVEKKTTEKPILQRKTEPVFVRPRPVRTGSSVSERALQRKMELPEIHIPKQESFNKSKSTKANDLKKQKQPNSPGGRLASFLNSLFMAAGNQKKTKVSTVDNSKLKYDRSSSSTCSSASSYSRSCLSKTPSSRGNLLKSVRFYPTSVIVDEDCRPCGEKSIYEREHDLGHTHLTVGKKKVRESPRLIFGEELKFHLMEKNRQVEEAAKDLLKGYRKKSEFLGKVMRDVHENGIDDDDDALSCASSDLFELENLDRYRDDLPVYETTRLGTNRTISNGLIR